MEPDSDDDGDLGVGDPARVQLRQQRRNEDVVGRAASEVGDRDDRTGASPDAAARVRGELAERGRARRVSAARSATGATVPDSTVSRSKCGWTMKSRSPCPYGTER